MDKKRVLEDHNTTDSRSVRKHKLGRTDTCEHSNVLNSHDEETELSDDELVIINDKEKLTGETNATTEEVSRDNNNDDTDGDVLLLNTPNVEVHVIDHDATNENDSDLEILSTREAVTPIIGDIRNNEENDLYNTNINDPSVSVELIDDWYGTETEANNQININQYDIQSDDNEQHSDESDDIIMLDGKPAPTTDELLQQIKIKENGKMQKNGTNSATESITNTKTFKDVTCAICMDRIEDAVAAACGHVFCAECIYRALASSREPGHGGTGPGGRRGKCPMCRKVVAYKNLVWLKVRYRKQI
jgi:hypothetical protein